MVAVEVAFDASREVCIAGLATVAGRVFAFGDTQEVVAVVVDDLSARVLWGDLWYLERAQADLTAETDDKLVTVGVSRAAEGFVLVGGEPTLLEPRIGSTFDSHDRVRVLWATPTFNYQVSGDRERESARERVMEGWGSVGCRGCVVTPTRIMIRDTPTMYANCMRSWGKVEVCAYCMRDYDHNGQTRRGGPR